MLLSQKTSVKLTENAANFIGHMCYAAYKLWNVCNYERCHYKELGLKEYPGIIRRKHGRIVCGLSSFPPRQHRKSVNFWTNHGNPFMH